MLKIEKPQRGGRRFFGEDVKTLNDEFQRVIMSVFKSKSKSMCLVCFFYCTFSVKFVKSHEAVQEFPFLVEWTVLMLC